MDALHDSITLSLETAASASPYTQEPHSIKPTPDNFDQALQKIDSVLAKEVRFPSKTSSQLLPGSAATSSQFLKQIGNIPAQAQQFNKTPLTNAVASSPVQPSSR